jgi:ABC-type multidrug transport system ATPase subunit
VLTVRGLTKSYGPRRVLDAVGFTVQPGEVLGLIGPNGAGKTTLFECLAGLLPADTGEVCSGDRLLPPAARKTELFYIPDGIAPWPDQTVACVLGFFDSGVILTRGTSGRIWGKERSARPDPSARNSPQDDRPIQDSLLDALHLRPLLRSPVRALSKGERKRFLIALGLLSPQPLLLLDEPFDGLDLRQTREATALLRATAARGKTLFLSIHQLTDAARACDRFVLLAGGRVVGEGTLAELRERAGVSPESGGMEEVFLALT